MPQTLPCASNSPITFPAVIFIQDAPCVHLKEREVCSRCQATVLLSCDFSVCFVDLLWTSNACRNRQPGHRRCLACSISGALPSTTRVSSAALSAIEGRREVWMHTTPRPSTVPVGQALFDASHRGDDTPAQSCIGRMNAGDDLLQASYEILKQARHTHDCSSDCPTLAHLSKHLPTVLRALCGRMWEW